MNGAESEEPLGPKTFKTLVDQIKDYAIFLLDPTGIIMTWNQGARRIKGYEAKEIIGCHFSTFYPAIDIENEKPQMELRIATDLGKYEEEGWRLRKDGTRFWASVTITALRDANSNLLGFGKVTHDLTQRKLHEDGLQRLLETEERFRLLVDQVRDYAIFVLDPRGYINSWNQGARRLKGYSSDEVIGKHFSIFYPPEELAIDKPALELSAAIRDGRCEEEGWRIRKDGSRFWANVIITALWDKRGSLTGFAKVTRDLTQRKLDEEALRQRTVELEAFAHTLSHDLRGPLRSISSFSEILQTEDADLSREEKTEYLEKIIRSVGTMNRLIDDVLEYSRLGQAAVTHEICPLDAVFAQVSTTLDSEIRQRQAAIDVDPGLPAVQGNGTLLLQIFSNLIANALKFVPPGRSPRIRIFARLENGEVQVHVRDNGIGIEPQFHQKIFDVFERLESGREIPGSGIGLAIVQKAAERLGGRVELESAPGEGSTFIVTLPAPVPAPTPTTVPA